MSSPSGCASFDLAAVMVPLSRLPLKLCSRPSDRTEPPHASLRLPVM